MINACIIGSSHVAAFTNAQDDIRRAHPDFNVEYFGVSFPNFDGLVVDAKGVFGVDRARSLAMGLRPGRVRSSALNINERASVDLAQYDAVFHVGQYVKLKDIIRIIAANDIDGFADRERPNRMSRAAFEAMAQEIVETHIPDWFGNMPTVVPTWASIVPFLSAGCLEDEGTEYEYLRRTAPDADAIAPILACVQEMIHQRYAVLGVTYVQQRVETTPQQVVTSPEHSTGSRRFGGDGESHGPRDYIHMNAAYAASCFDEFANQVRASLTAGREQNSAMRAR